MVKLDPSMAVWDVECSRLSKRPLEHPEGSSWSRETLENKANSNSVGRSEQTCLGFRFQMRTEKEKEKIPGAWMTFLSIQTLN